ncbi:conserved membrane protein of unknown function [Tenacibaculum sp. 190524A02b]|uniref:hypothetical protein n=1 Tax=Tenacibaculum vairaonense TaxID=3137860 RepID=UPI0032B157C1
MTTATKPTSDLVKGISPQIVNELSKEINNMLSYAIYNGIIINTEVNSLIQNSSVDDLINAHNLLAKNISPATPKSIEFTKRLRSSETKKSIFNKLPLVRNLILLALTFLLLFIITGLSPQVNNHSLDEGIMNNNGISLLLNLAFLSSVAGLGVLFFLLKKVSDSLKSCTLVPEESISYIAQIILGIIAGLILSEIISFYSSDPKSINLFSKSILALIGGFSSDAIFTVLQGIIDRIKTIFTSPIIR